MPFLTDEHVPSVFITTLLSNGHEVVEAKEMFGEATENGELLRYAGEMGHLLITHDKKDFAGEYPERVDHGGIIVYTDANFLRDDSDGAVRTVERVLDHYPREELQNELVWLDAWRR